MSQIIIEEKKLEHNIELIKEKANAKVDDNGNPLKIIAVLKGNAYGIGVKILAEKLLDYQIDFFAVSEVEEAVELRKYGFTNDILVLNSTCILEEVEKIVAYNLVATIDSEQSVKALDDEAKKQSKIVRCHLKIDTGFCRFGFRATENIAENVKKAIENRKQIKIEGTYSHFQESYSKEEKTTRQQFNIFLEAVSNLKKNNIETGMLHICNSSAFFKYPDMYLNAVRIGSAFSGRLQIGVPTGLQKVGYLESQVCKINDLKKGDKVGYSGTYQLKGNKKVAVVEAGYADGIGLDGPKDSVRIIDKLRFLKKGIYSFFKDTTRYVIINEEKYPILGRIGMKNFVIDITNRDIKIGDKVKIDVKLVLVNSNVERILR